MGRGKGEGPASGSWSLSSSKRNRSLLKNRPLFVVQPSGCLVARQAKACTTARRARRCMVQKRVRFPMGAAAHDPADSLSFGLDARRRPGFRVTPGAIPQSVELQAGRFELGSPLCLEAPAGELATLAQCLNGELKRAGLSSLASTNAGPGALVFRLSRVGAKPAMIEPPAATAPRLIGLKWAQRHHWLRRRAGRVFYGSRPSAS